MCLGRFRIDCVENEGKEIANERGMKREMEEKERKVDEINVKL